MNSLPDKNNCSIAVIGLGYVGLPVAMEFAKQKKSFVDGKKLNHKIIGYDINENRISELRKGLIKFPQVLVNVLVADKVKVLDAAALKKTVEQAKNTLGDSGRILVRASGTESLIRVMLEGEDRKHINLVAGGVVKAIEEINTRIS